MAGKKKSKKAPSNPARGFATVSTVSKSKADDEEPADTDDALPESHKPIVEPQQASAQESKGARAEAELSELTPDQLEARLEESELQILLEKHQDKSKRDANRFVSRLKTDRRLLRGPAERLYPSSWLTEELMSRAIERMKATSNAGATNRHPRSAATSPLPEEDLIVRLWTLERALVDLDFTETSIKDVLIHLLKASTLEIKTPRSGTKDALWGADECMDYLAVNSLPGDLPPYDGDRTEVTDSPEPTAAGVLSETGKNNSPKTKDSGAVKSPQKAPASSKQSLDSNTKPQEIDADARDSDSDVEPKDQLRKYLEFKTRLFRRRPDLMRDKPKKGKKSKAKEELPREPLDKASAKLQQRIRKLERDLLFDKDEADEAWSNLRITLENEAAAVRQVDKEPPAVLTEPTQTEHHTSGVSKPGEDSPTGEIGDLFLGLPQDPNGTETTTTDPQSPEAHVKTLNSRVFGPWTGLSPRRIFEEACKARDSTCKITFSQPSSTAFSSQHKLRVEWTRPQKVPYSITISGLTCTWSKRVFTVEMVDVSCPDKKQSEAFISTAALFLVFSHSPKEEKVYVRLPSVWRELWFEFVELRRQQEDAADCERLREVRDLVRGQQTPPSPGHITDSLQGVKMSDDSTTEIAALNRDFDVASAQSTVLSQLWASKISSPAYGQMVAHRKNLPIWSFKETLLDEVSRHQVIILCGETGCGKSTQVPAFILEDELSMGRDCKIYCTQPRRISAISLARRVSQELGEGKNAIGTVRSLIGYSIRLESKTSSSTKLVYATTGVLMRMLESNNNLDSITHIVVDEVHERTIDSDFLLIVLRRLMLKRPELKVILMSATVDAEHFSSYLGGAPIINVPGRTYPVETLFLEDAIEVTGFGSGLDSTRKRETRDEDSTEDEGQVTVAGDLTSYSARTRQVLSEMDEYRISYELIIRLLETVAMDRQFEEYSKAILVFLPGIAEIRRVNDLLSANDTFSRDWLVYPLHSTISTEDQEQAFLVPPRGMRKIVLATNIAETGITIPDITCVVDTGKHREMRFDERRQLSRLLEAFISQANAKQRRGRSGRVQKGLCFHLFTRVRHDRLMPDSQTPEMLRLSLQDLALRVKISRLGDIEPVLAEALDPPLPKNVRRAVDSLVEVKALTATEELTALGRQLAKLPLDVYLGKLILLSCIFKCVDAGLSIAAILSAKSPFLTPINVQTQAHEARLAFKRGDSDLLTVYNAYCSWRRICKASVTSEFHYCRRNFLNPQTLSNIEDLKNQLATALVDAGFLKLGSEETDSLHRARHYSRKRRFLEIPKELDYNSENDTIVNAIVSASFYPKLLIREGKAYRNLSNNQIVSLHPSSVNKGTTNPPKFLSFYHVMQSSSRFYHAHETSAVDELTVALLCGDADFRMYSGVLSLDSNRLRFSLPDWMAMAVIKSLRAQLRGIMHQGVESPGRELSEEQRDWFDMWQLAFSKQRLAKS